MKEACFNATEARLFWIAALAYRNAVREGASAEIVAECLDEIEVVGMYTDQPQLRQKAREIVAWHSASPAAANA